MMFSRALFLAFSLGPSFNLHHSLVKDVTDNSWMPICRVESVSDSFVTRLELANNTFGVFNTKQGYRVLNDHCSHRHFSISNQPISGGEIECPYHGAKFSADSGECTSFLGCKTEWDGRLESYESRVDQDGVLWSRLKDASGDFPELPYNPGEREKTVRGATDVDASVFDVMENLLDCIHVHKVHRFGNKNDPVPKNLVRVPVSLSSCGYTYEYESGGSSVFITGPSSTVKVSNGFYGPLSAYSTVTFGESGKYQKNVRVSVLPLTEGKSRLFWSIGRNFMTHDAVDPMVEWIMRDTIAEDASILRQMDPRRASSRQTLTEFDWIIARFRMSILNIKK